MSKVTHQGTPCDEGSLPWLEPEALAAFSESAREAVYEAIALRRDVRHFQRRPVDGAVLTRVLEAAHRAPSVGLSQPWGFVIVRDEAQRGRIRESFLRCRAAEAARYPDERRQAYLAHRLEGILEAPLNLCVAADLRSTEEAILGTTVQPEAVRASACLSVQNLWLAARAEGIGVGWVSIVEPAVLRQELALPPGVEPVAYLCIGHPAAFRTRPMLEESGWRRRKPLADVVHEGGHWSEHGAPSNATSSADADDEHAPPETVTAAPALDEPARAAARAHQRLLTKPIGSLGKLEEIATWYAAARGAFPVASPRHAPLLVFAADHGVVVEGVSAYGSAVTAAMVANVMAGGAAVNALANECAVPIVLIDVGVAGDLSSAPLAPRVVLRSERVRPGTANIAAGPAMSVEEAQRALAVGARVVAEMIDAGAGAIGLGEIGIGNTTAASALSAHYLGVRARAVVGAGTGIDEPTRRRKVAVVESALARHRADLTRPTRVLARIGGLEVAALAGAMVESARRRVPVVLDGFVTQAAALVARALDPGVAGYLLASHVSTEPGSRRCLEALGCSPLFDLGMRVGEGTGAVLGLAVLRAAVTAQDGMATFATSGVVDRLERR